ncbi:TetR/AcrR family transcriptional regulator [Solicola gregarius]|uniref:TetR family transcriptional regulator n=1 Tax=Solicola gregarius TaxID=2908642 RepID=A0AA46YK55_9ACTN|nr:TetR family transcriptional regulator [Solicola gregarius]UYM03658.1 TetR family transcriptional regulator [Solicola gregarius]
MARVSSHDRRDQLVEAAIRVATREGVGAVTTRTVAAEAGATPGIVHYVYRSMTDLLRDMVKAIADEQIHRVTSVQVEGSSVRECLERAFEALWTTLESEPDVHLLTYEVTDYALRHEELGDLAGWQYRCYFDAAATALESVAKAASVEWVVPAESLARLIVAVNDGVSLAWLVDRDTDRARGTYGQVIDHLVEVARPV